MLRNQIKKVLLSCPVFILRMVVKTREWFWWQFCKIWERNQSFIPLAAKQLPINKAGILIYAIHGLSHAGTERNLQLVANSLSAKHDVYYMYGQEPGVELRATVLNKNITLVPFTYSYNEVNVPHRIYDMSVRLTDVINQYNIKCLVTASPGYSHYPWNLVRNIPIVLLNIFGAPTLQPNVKKVIYNSLTTRRHAEQWLGDDPRAEVQYAPLFSNPPDSTRELGAALRKKLRIDQDDFVFGRIGRADDGIFDPIGIRAWQKIVGSHPNAHYIIMSPPPALTKIVLEENIKRVHLLPPSSLESDVWSFHGALDAMAHFRFDGETSGVAIAESLTIGNPVISHRSHIWNAHVDYLLEPHSIVVDKGDIDAYAKAMEVFLSDKDNRPELWSERKILAQSTGYINFNPTQYNKFINNVISGTIQD